VSARDKFVQEMMKPSGTERAADAGPRSKPFRSPRTQAPGRADLHSNAITLLQRAGSIGHGPVEGRARFGYLGNQRLGLRELRFGFVIGLLTLSVGERLLSMIEPRLRVADRKLGIKNTFPICLLVLKTCIPSAAWRATSSAR
jgi:hypothetical protein